jgi:hypothetical protein
MKSHIVILPRSYTVEKRLSPMAHQNCFGERQPVREVSRGDTARAAELARHEALLLSHFR